VVEPRSGDEAWHALLSGQFDWARDRRRFGRIPGSKRCKNCLAPLQGLGSFLMRRIGRGPYVHNPRFCEF
jgi:adenylate cyclase